AIVGKARYSHCHARTGVIQIGQLA
ncbi:hypothetical protein LCGC14_3093170, partial [marine sediment metagenome]